MRSISVILLFLFIVLSAQAQTVTFSDPNLLSAVIDEGVDVNKDGKIQAAEAVEVKRLRVKDYEIESLEGIQAFQNLEDFNCAENVITSLTPLAALKKIKVLDISYNEISSIPNENILNLISIDCSNNKLKSLSFISAKNIESIKCNENPELISLNVTGLLKLAELDFSECAVTSINLSGLTLLKYLYCEENKLVSLNLLSNKKLVVVDCSGNQLTSLQIENLPLLEKAYCSNNSITSISVKGLLMLVELKFEVNKLTTLDLTGAPNLELLYVNDNQLQSLDIRPCPKLNMQLLATHNNASTFKIIK